MQKGNVKLAAVTAAVVVILLLFSWQWAPSDDGVSSDFADAVSGGDAEAAYASLVPELREQYEQLGGLEYFQTQMSALGAQNVLSYGPLVSVGDSYEPGAEGISCTYMEYAYSGMLMWTHETEAGVDAFYMTPRDLPSSISGLHDESGGHLDAVLMQARPLREIIADMERDFLRRAIEVHGSVRRVSELFQVNRSTIFRKLHGENDKTREGKES